MKRKIVMNFAVVLSAAMLLTGCFGTNETPSDSSVPESTSAPINSEAFSSEEESVFTEEETAYQEWKSLEEKEPAFDQNGAAVEPSELLRRAVMVETFLQDYPETTYREDAVEYYNRLVTAAITGGYVSEGESAHLYLDEEGKKINKDIVDTYNTFLEENAGTKTANIVEEYVTLLGNEEGNFTDAVKAFYVDVVERMKNMFDMGMESITPDTSENVPSEKKN